MAMGPGMFMEVWLQGALLARSKGNRPLKVCLGNLKSFHDKGSVVKFLKLKYYN
jgi:hypothetical protein